MAVALPPPAPGYLAPPAWPVALDWTEEEQRALEAGMARYPPDHYDMVQRYVKIAAMLPRKSVRDVALRARWTINQQQLKKRKPGELLPTSSGAKKLLAPGLLPPKAPTLPPVPMVSPLHLLIASKLAAGQAGRCQTRQCHQCLPRPASLHQAAACRAVLPRVPALPPPPNCAVSPLSLPTPSTPPLCTADARHAGTPTHGSRPACRLSHQRRHRGAHRAAA
jgi:hypothetical protein